MIEKSEEHDQVVTGRFRRTLTVDTESLKVCG